MNSEAVKRLYAAAAVEAALTAYTQTYSTASRTHADLTAAAVTDGTITGTADGALALVGATNSGDVSAAIMANFKDLQAQGNALLADLTNVKQVLNALIDDLQTMGVLS